MVRTRRWLAPLIVGALVAALAGGYWVTRAHPRVDPTQPSGIVLRVARGEHWQVSTRLWSGADAVVASGTGPLANDHIVLPPGRYWVPYRDPSQPKCPHAAEYVVHAHRWATKPSGYASASCSIQ